MALPASIQVHKQAMIDSNVTPPEPATVPEKPSASVPDAQSVTVGRKEFNELQAAADRARSAEGRADALTQDMDVLQRRLTELEKAPKSIPNAGPHSQSSEVYSLQPVEFSDEEQQEYGESKGFIRKVAIEVLNEQIPAIVNRLGDDIKKAMQLAESSSSAVSNIHAQTFTERVKSKVPEFERCVEHENWQDYLKSINEYTGKPISQLITDNLKAENLAGMVKIFADFKNKYGVGGNTPTGYEGDIPNGGGAVVEGPRPNGILAFSERKKAHKDFVSGTLSFEEYGKIKKKFDAADKEGRIDYSK